jgi:hypothetical protein
MAKRMTLAERISMTERIIMQNGEISFEELVLYTNTSPLYLKKILDIIIRTNKSFRYDPEKEKYIFKKLD